MDYVGGQYFIAPLGFFFAFSAAAAQPHDFSAYGCTGRGWLCVVGRIAVATQTMTVLVLLNSLFFLFRLINFQPMNALSGKRGFKPYCFHHSMSTHLPVLTFLLSRILPMSALPAIHG